MVRRNNSINDLYDVFSVRNIDGDNLFESDNYEDAFDYMCKDISASYLEGECLDGNGRCYSSDILACQDSILREEK